MVKVIQIKLKGFTIMESIVAMVVLILCFGFASTLMVKVMTSEDQIRKNKAFLIAKEKVQKVKTGKLYIDEVIQVGDFLVETKIDEYRKIQGLIWVSIVVKDGMGKTLCELNQLANK